MPPPLIRNGLSWLLVAVAAFAAPLAHAQAEQQKLVDDATATFSNFLRDPEMTWLQQNIGRAKGVLIAPEVGKVGFIIGGSGGRALLVAKDPKTRRWGGPAFYVLATASIGFQAGVSVSETVALVMTDRALNSLLSTSFKIGPDISVAAGPVGAGAKADVVTDMVTYSRAKGIYGGINLDGTGVNTADDWNEIYYGRKGVLPPDILLRQNVRNKNAGKLLSAVARATTRKN
jgi:lipid-binding SYLF domain-containing protein